MQERESAEASAMGPIGLALGGGWLARGLSTAVAQYLGKISYSMYILHIPVLWWFGNLVPAPMDFSREWMAMMFLTAVVALAYGLVEVPANKWVRGMAGLVDCDRVADLGGRVAFNTQTPP